MENQKTENRVGLGSMQLQKPSMSIMLVFGRDDSQSHAFVWAAERGGYRCTITHNAETALETFLAQQPNVVIIDHRSTKHFNAESLCRTIRATKASEYTIILAVTKKPSGENLELCVQPILNAGFNKRFIECHNVGVCLNELLMLDQVDLCNVLRVQAAEALLSALDNVSDPVQITSESHQVQYVNSAFEKLSGYSCEEVVGREGSVFQDHTKHDSIQAQVKKGKAWEGLQAVKTKAGDNVSCWCRLSPVLSRTGQTQHYINILSSSDSGLSFDKFNMDIAQFSDMRNGSIRRGSLDVKSQSSANEFGAFHGYARRRESIARIHSMTIEAPITKVINIINTAQQNSPNAVAEALETVLEILRTSELYSPLLAQQNREQDPVTSDLMGGLMTGVKRRESSTEVAVKHGSHSHHVHHPVEVEETPEIKAILDREALWDFRIIDLEKLTNNRPLVHLGIRTLQRFSVLTYLGVGVNTMLSWLHLIEAHYYSTNPYHNSTHATDVLHASAYFLERERLKSVFDDMDEVGILISAIIHDLEHPGKTNSFLINAGDKLALLYNDLAVLESHHVSTAFTLTQREDRTNIFKNLSSEDFRAMRQQIIDMVLATEMTKHFEHVNKFIGAFLKAKPDEDPPILSRRPGSPDSAAGNLASPENRLLIKRMLIKCADVSNPARPLPSCIEWAKRIAEEYCNQTEEEKARKLPVVMPVFDRKACNIPKSQISFIDLFINDMYSAWHEFCDVPELLSHLETNYNFWKDREESGLVNIQEEDEANESIS